MQLLKVSTAFTEIVGPILDSAGAEYIGAVIGDLSISKNGTEAAMAAAATLTHVSNGYYTLVGTTGNSDTLGRITIRCNKSTYQMPPKEYMVLAAAAFDVLITNGTIASQTNITAAAGCAVSSIGANVITAASIAADAITAAKIADGAIDAATFAAGAINAAAIADGAIDRATFAADTGQQTIRSNTAQAGASTTITLDASASAVDSFYVNDIVYITGGTGAGQGRFITAYVGSTKVATVRAWTTTPDNTSTFAILPCDAGLTAALIAAGVWDLATSGHTTSGTFGAAMNAAGSAGDPWATSLPGAYGSGTAGHIVGTALPDIAPGSVNGLLRAGTNTATTVNLTGSLSGNVGGIAGTTNTFDALQTALNSTHGAGSWATATGFSTHSASDVWAVATRVLTAGTNIALAKGTGVTGFNDPTAASIATAVLTTQMTESYNVDGVAPTLAQAAFMTMQRTMEFSISGTAITVHKLDGTTQAAVLTMDSATTPTSSTRSA